MERYECESAGLNPERRPRSSCQRRSQAAEHRVDHRVPDEVDSRGTDALGDEICHGSFGMNEQDPAEMIRQSPVRLFGHRVVEASKSSLDVRHRNLELRCRERARECGVNVARDDDEGRPLLQERPFDAKQRLRRLLRMGASADAEEHMRLWQVQLLHEDRRHLRVVVLARVHEEQLWSVIELAQRTIDGRRLHEVRPRADDEANARARFRLPRFSRPTFYQPTFGASSAWTSRLSAQNIGAIDQRMYGIRFVKIAWRW